MIGGIQPMDKKKILIVEDDIIVSEDIKAKLESLNYRILDMVSSGKQVLKVINTSLPDLILMDIKLKGDLNGIQVAEIIRAQYSIPIVFLTAYSDDALIERAKKVKPEGYIVKPFDEVELKITIEIALYKFFMDDKLRIQHEWYSTTLKSIGDAVIATDAKGNVQFLNPIAQKLTAWNEKDAIGQPLSRIFYIVNEKTRKRCENPVEKVIETGEIQGLANDTVLIAKDGKEFIIADSGSPIRNANGKIVGVVLVFQDITHKKILERQLIQAQKMDAIGTLAGGIAHDFNNMLSVITGNISYALSLLDDEDRELKETLSDVEVGARQAQKLTQQLLTFAKGGHPIFKKCAIIPVISDAAIFACRGTNVRCDLNLPSDLWNVEIDPGQINQVINNIVINAVQAMPDGGIITIRGQNYEADKADSFLSLSQGRYVQISFQDSGVGIPKSYLSKIFEPYFSTKQKGSGIGLASVYSIIQHHHGHITVESKLEEGSTFVIYLPATTDEIAESAAPPCFSHKGQGNILIMDDLESVLQMSGRILKKLGYEPYFATDGAHAVKKYKEALESNNPFKLVILDLMVPGGMGGIETLQELKEIDPDVKAVVSSGYSNNPIMSDFQSYGFVDVIPKPYTISQVANLLNKID
jgi:PAS domain S-box-containing protein